MQTSEINTTVPLKRQRSRNHKTKYAGDLIGRRDARVLRSYGLLARGFIASVMGIFFATTPASPAAAQTLVFQQGRGVPVCDAYKSHLERYIQLARVLVCGERFFDRSTASISAPQWRRLELKKHLGLYEKLQRYEISVKAKDYSWSKSDIEIQMNAAKSAGKSGDTSMWVAAVDLESSGSAQQVVVVQQGACLRTQSLEEDELAAGRWLGIDLSRRLKQRNPGGAIYLVNKGLTDIDRAHHERVFGPGGGVFGLFQFQGKTYIDAFDLIEKGNFFGSGRFTVMGTPAVGRASTCQVEYRSK